MGIIKELFNGEIYPFEAISPTKEALEAERMLDSYFEEADKAIPKDGNEDLSDKVRYQISTVQNLLAEQCFEMGFALGIRLVTESFSTKIKQ